MKEPTSPLGEIEFVVRSPHRTAVLTALSVGPHDRTDLRALTGASSPTLGRVLSDFEDRGWIARRGPAYEVCPLGAFVAEGISDLLGRMDTARKLRTVARWLPTESLNLDLEWLADAQVTLPTRSDPLAPMQRANELEREASRSRVLTHALPGPCLRAHHRAILAGVHQLDAVLTPEVVETMTEPAHASRFAAILASEESSVFVHDGDIPTVVGINDGIVYLGIDDERGAPLALIESSGTKLRSWAEATIDTYRQESSRLTVPTFAREAPIAVDRAV